NIAGGRRGGGTPGVYNEAAMAVVMANEGGTSNDVAFYNNSAYQLNGSYGCLRTSLTTATQFRNNICYMGSAILSDGGTRSIITNTGCDGGCTTADDPRFRDPARDDLHLTIVSPDTIARAGLSLSTVFTTDYDGITRTQSAPWAMG